ncbi:MAG TPA: regulatory protein RecX [Rhodanobacter sp.]|nr:regulatory protein RecX [Rhodanobacter sp.]
MRSGRRVTPGTPSTGPSAYDRALRMLARREYSNRELHTRLTQLGHAEAEVAAALARLETAHYQDDQRFAEMLLRSRIAQGYGPLRLHAELKNHGFADARIRELLDAAEVDWDACAVAQLLRRYGTGSPSDRAARVRRAQFLLRRGFAAATVRAATQADVGPSADPES